jgi:hypothetical protein
MDLKQSVTNYSKMSKPIPISIAMALMALVFQTTGIAAVSLDAICSNQFVPLKFISETMNLIKANQENPVESCKVYKESFDDLENILEVVQGGHICNLDLVDKIRDFHFKYVHNPSELKREDSERIPTSLRYFFMSLCFQISANCKKNLINDLEYVTKGQITEDDYEEIKLLEKHDANLVGIKSQVTDFDDILLLDDLNEVAGAEQGEDENEVGVIIKVKTNQVLGKLLRVCQRKFKPFYDRLIMPLIRLSNLGYNYEGELLEREIDELKTNQLARRWYYIVQVCESLRSFKIYEDPDDVVDTYGVPRQQVTLISKDEAAMLERRNLKPVGEENLGAETGKPIEFHEIVSHNDDELWIQDQEELHKLVKQHKASATERDRIKERLFKMIVSKLKELLFSGKVLWLVSDLIKCKLANECETRKSVVNSELIEMIDEVVEMDEIEKGTAIEPLDGPVAQGKYTFIKNGPKFLSSRSGIPPKVTWAPKYEDQTKTTRKMWRWGMNVLPDKMSILCWIVAIISIILIMMMVGHGG